MPPSSKSFQSEFELSALASLLAVSGAIESADEAAFEQLRSQAEPEVFWNDVSRVSGYATFACREGGALREQHAVIWMVPVVTLPGYATVIETKPQAALGVSMLAWLRDWFGLRQDIQMLHVPWSLHSLTAMSPVQLRRVLEILTSRRSARDFPEIAAATDLRFPSEMPQLGFFIGTAALYGQYPRIPGPGRPDDAGLLNRLTAAMQYWSGNNDTGPVGDHLLGIPMGLGAALKAGLMMWARACWRNDCLAGWNLALHQADLMSLDTVWPGAQVLEDSAGIHGAMSRSEAGASSIFARPWQLGHQGVGALTESLTETFGMPSPNMPSVGRIVFPGS